MAKNTATENAPKAGTACGKSSAPAKKDTKADSKPSKGAKK
ncbi:hypothetical protein RSJ42_07725 [Methanosarcina hadiensis]